MKNDITCDFKLLNMRWNDYKLRLKTLLLYWRIKNEIM